MTTTTRLSEVTGDYVIDTARTRIGFLAHAMGSRARGQFDQFAGGAHLDGGDPSRSSAALTIQVSSIQTRNPRRDGHLRGKFLDVGTYPAITFTSTGVEQVDPANFRVTGDLTVRGVPKRITIDVRLAGAGNDPAGDFRVRFTGSVTINRMDWDVNWNAVTRLTINDKVTLDLDIAAIRRP